jgi:ribosomal protein L40E
MKACCECGAKVGWMAVPFPSYYLRVCLKCGAEEVVDERP